MENEVGNEKIINADIMIIDDDVNMMDILTVVLNKYGHKVATYTEPVAAIEELRSNHYDILLVNYLMSPVNGDRIVELVREFNKDIYIILMSIHKDLAPSIDTMQNLDIQAYFEKSSRFDQLIMFIQSGLKYIEQVRRITNMGIKLEHYLVDFAQILLKTVDAKDHYTKEHSKRVSDLSESFAKYLNLSSKQELDLKTGSLFHDIGKIGIPDSILLKEGKLTDEEYETIKLHPVIGANIFSLSDIYKDVSPIIYYHHEKYDGTGYPDHLKGDKIPYLARILSITDSFDAIVSRRPYKDVNTIDFAIEQIRKGKEKQFDSTISEQFISYLNSNLDSVKDILQQ